VKIIVCNLFITGSHCNFGFSNLS